MTVIRGIDVSLRDPAPYSPVPCFWRTGLLLVWQSASIDISLGRFNEWRSGDNLVGNIEHNKDDRADVGEEKGGDIESGDERSESLSQGDEDIEKETVPS